MHINELVGKTVKSIIKNGNDEIDITFTDDTIVNIDCDGDMFDGDGQAVDTEAVEEAE